jgi:3'(2'), 5'-bisphosphate nucleotidase
VSATRPGIAPELLEPVLALARAAGEAILRVYTGDFAVGHKDDRSPLTEADLAAHHLIVDGLRALSPELPVLSEESAGVPWSERREWRRYWLVDPLDGTREFVKKNGEFTVNIALVDDGIPVFGVVHAPVFDELHFGLRGEGAWHCDASGRVPIAVRRPATTPLRVAASRSHADPRTAAAVARMGDVDLVSLGSSLKFCRLAEARLDAYLRFAPTSEWDTAAGQCVLEAAGGAVLGLDGLPLRYNTKDSLLNPDFLALGDPGLPWRDWLDD